MEYEFFRIIAKHKEQRAYFKPFKMYKTQDKEIEAILLANPIVDVVSRYVTLKKAGSGYKGLSPFTKERTPSLMVSPSKHIFKDFSSGKGGDSITFLMEIEAWDFPTALKQLATWANIEIDDNLSAEQVALSKVDKANKALQSLFLMAPDYSYFESKGISQKVQIEFGIGKCHIEFWADFQIAKLDMSILKLAGAGDTNYCRFMNRITVPIHDQHGTLVGFGGRIVEDDPKSAKYMNTADSDRFKKSEIVFNLNRARADISHSGEAWLVEGYTDIMAMWQIHFKNTVSSMGTNLTVGQANLIRKYCATINVAFDGDKAGFDALMRSIPILIKAAFIINIWELPEGKDPAEVIKEGVKPTAVPFFEFWKHYERKVTISKRYEGFGLIQEAIDQIHDPYLKSIYYKELQLILI